MQQQLERIAAAAREALKAAATAVDVEQLQVKVLGKKGELTQLLRSMGGLSAEEWPVMGKLVNDLRQTLEQEIGERLNALQTAEKVRRLNAERIDVTIPGKPAEVGHIHPLSLVREELENIFIGMGFEIAEGPEIEWDHFNFELLNLPANLTDAQILTMAQNGQGNTDQIDRDIFKTGFFGVPNGNNTVTIVTYEITGNSNVQSVTLVAEQAMQLAREVDIAVQAMSEVRDLTTARSGT